MKPLFLLTCLVLLCQCEKHRIVVNVPPPAVESPGDRYIRSLFEDGLTLRSHLTPGYGRAPTTSELQQLEPIYSQTDGRAGVVAKVMTMPEFSAARVDELFQETLGRDPSSAESQTYVSDLASKSYTAVLQEIVELSEYWTDASNQYGSYYSAQPTAIQGSQAASLAFVNDLYVQVLGRPAPNYCLSNQDSGCFSWAATIPAPTDPSFASAVSSVVNSITTSHESHQHMVTVWFNEFLHRAPNPDVTNDPLSGPLVTQLDNGSDYEPIVKAILTTDEYFSYAQNHF